MGADMLIISIEENHPERTLEDRLALIDATTPEEASRIFEAAEQIDYASLYGGDDDAEPELELVKSKLREAVKGIHGDPEAGGYMSREVTWITVGNTDDGQRIFLTGGMSWGDDPSEMFRPFSYLVETDIL